MICTELQVLLYAAGLFAADLLPLWARMSGPPYPATALVLSTIFITYAVRLYRSDSDRQTSA